MQNKVIIAALDAASAAAQECANSMASASNCLRAGTHTERPTLGLAIEDLQAAERARHRLEKLAAVILEGVAAAQQEGSAWNA